MRTSHLLALGITALVAVPAHAGDGRIEINQTCATQSGCGPGDSPGFPVSTQTGGSYVLTGDLTLPAPDSEGVRLTPGTTLDLGGFTISGPATCTGTPPACTNTNSGGYGVLVLGTGTTIRNGRIRGAGSDGLYGSSFTGSLVENVVAEANGRNGFNLSGAGSQVIGCRATRNGADGFYGGYQGSAANLYHGNVAQGNADDGFDVSGALLLDNVATSNGDYGLFTNYQDTDSAWGRNFFDDNNGGNANPQAAGGNQLGANVCGSGACP